MSYAQPASSWALMKTKAIDGIAYRTDDEVISEFSSTAGSIRRRLRRSAGPSSSLTICPRSRT
jgi:hypothetical protein